MPLDPKLLERLHELLTQDLIEKIESGNATAADLGVARQLLKDNSINAMPAPNTPIFRLANSLPFENDREAV